MVVEFRRRELEISELKEDLMKKAWSVVLVLAVIVMAGYGSTKAYSADKTVVYRSSMYNISNVTHFTSKVEAKTAEGENVDLTNYDKTRFEALPERDTQEVLRVRQNAEETRVRHGPDRKVYEEKESDPAQTQVRTAAWLDAND